VCVKSPIKDEKYLRKLLKEKENWINAKLMHLNDTPSHHYGQTIRFRGEIFPIENFESLHKKVEKAKNTINIKKYYNDFYKNEALLTLPSRIKYYAQKMKLYPQEIRYKAMKRRWGSCTSNGVVTFNSMMMQLSYEHIDYVIVHELAHLKHMNHSLAFHACVREILGNERELRHDLKGIQIL
jgi:hypothetical protein